MPLISGVCMYVENTKSGNKNSYTVSYLVKPIPLQYFGNLGECM